MTGAVVDLPAPFEGCPGAPAALEVKVAMQGLAPGASVSLEATADYDFAMLGCGVTPSPCVWGSETTDPAVRLCSPEYSEPTKGSVHASARFTADARGQGTTSLRFAVGRAVAACPAGPSRPWYVETGTWILRVTDADRGLQLDSGQDITVGP